MWHLFARGKVMLGDIDRLSVDHFDQGIRALEAWDEAERKLQTDK